MEDPVQRTIKHLRAMEKADGAISDEEALRRGKAAARMDAELSLRPKRNFDDDFDDYIQQKSLQRTARINRKITPER
ncbi:hypothetical protein CEV31_4248 [Brucella thiophenivorans]|uniref:Uncharacterized protein n=2 Tax=Brucella thiophenivorans TaxID=571255 RepID=A0A256FU47_9HYPH|nr:hypothetical protein CEV31_4248 [Brucella thiophenivorans]